ncbi:MAG: FHA domain-containing protein [Saccharofermentans sp.]|nr:FHA domain-containing protein [Saccharofermentans sp.]
MQIKKGPFGYFAVERFDSPEFIFSYAGEVIAANRSGCLLPCSIDLNGFSSSAYFDFSGLISIRQSGSALMHGSRLSRKLTKLLEDRRRSAGDFFCSVPVLLDKLISPSELVLDPEYVFTDEKGACIRFCLRPAKSQPENLRLSSLGAERLESFLSEPFFEGVLTNDEKQELIYSVKTDDESLFLKTARQIRESEIGSSVQDQMIEMDGSNAPRHLPDRRNIHADRSPELLWSLACSIAAAASLYLAGFLPSLLFILASGVFLVRFFINNRTKKSKEKDDDRSLSDMRRMIYFSDEDESERVRASEDSPGRDTEPLHPVTPLVTGTLTATSPKDGATRTYSLLMDRTTIGSDVFLSDIVVDDPSVDPLHAIIYLSGRSFFISDCSKRGTTYIDDKKAAMGRRCEIKNGQKITIGAVDFRFKALLSSTGQAWISEHLIRNAL